MGGVYTGPYNLTLTVGSQQTPVQLVCDDAFDEVYQGENWQANTSTFPGLSNVQFTGQSMTQNYEEAGYLVQQLFADTGNSTTTGEIQWAIWDVFDPGISNKDPWGTLTSQEITAINNWLTQAQNDYSAGSYANLEIYTAIPGSQIGGSGRAQEFFGMNSLSMPEPMTFWSLLVVLAAIGLALKRVDKTTVESPASART